MFHWWVSIVCGVLLLLLSVQLMEVEEQARGDKRGVCKTERIAAHIKFLSNGELNHLSL